MLPAVVIGQVQSALLDYLRTTFNLQDKELETALFDFASSGAWTVSRTLY